MSLVRNIGISIFGLLFLCTTIFSISESSKVIDNGIESWTIYSNNNFEIRYPKQLLNLKSIANGVLLSHAIPYKHSNPCDMSGESSILKDLIDFSMDIELYNMNFKQLLISQKNEDMCEYLLTDNSFKLEPGFIDEIGTNELKGYKVSSGCEGCGIYKYYFSLNKDTTLLITRPYSIFNPLMAESEHKKYLSLPGIITKEEEEKLFRKILLTFRYK
jgi:hypothetical protein